MTNTLRTVYASVAQHGMMHRDRWSSAQPALQPEGRCCLTSAMAAAATVILVDDDQRMIAHNTAALEQAHFLVHSATTIDRAMDLFAVFSPDVVILDVSMTEGDDAGFDLCRTIRCGSAKTVATRADVLIALLTGRNSSDDRHQGLAAGADLYLTKPMRSAQLVQEISRLLHSAFQPGGSNHDNVFREAVYSHCGGYRPRL